ncbi:1-acylglycerol-3-phosphate O-acyltransferase Pnpla3-like isoform X2 [Cebidichthys violaceus]|uniref:1-acylglycerol-3-phosphate O-acyltransferase Pnpla3-like isoform X2 n=1 Tax=Cebidichthys violaceus TaxID=271503 RepID=UPI0035CA7F9F
MAKICQNGYTDALRFLQENNLISSECPPRSSETDSAKPACCEPKAEQPAADGESDDGGQQNGEKTHEEEHCWLDPRLTEDLPVDIQKALCEACRETHAAGGLLSRMAEYLPKRVTSYLQIPCALPVKSAFSLAQRLVDWILDVPRDVSRLYSMAGGLYKQAWKDDVTDGDRCTSLPLGLNLSQRKEDLNTLLAHPGAPPPRPPTASGFGDDATDSPQKRW